MKPAQRALKTLLKNARRAKAPPLSTDDPDTLSPGLVTRIAANWAASPGDLSTGLIWERVAAGGLALSLAVCVTTALLRPEEANPTEPDAMLSLFLGNPAKSDGFPF
ncbi:MAG: hypothetical protein KDK97_01170 [Verrucomicrobiales bacterium]|nr:hypothetical protein [Verrucomicrobiales bacterium]MCP5559182.1 hypothetical protein [Verrucomicrobiaceae bacterium]